MATCDTCGNNESKTFTVTYEGQSATFDSLECAIHALAPACARCGCRVLGHGVEDGGRIYCCDHCARMSAAGPTEPSGAEPVPQNHIGRWKDDGGAVML